MAGMDYIAPPPPITPAAGTLLAAAFTPSGGVSRTFVPLGYRAASCAGWELLAACDDTDAEHDPDGDTQTVQAMPVTIQTIETCSTFGLDDLEQRARDRIAAIESAAIAHELWTGELATAAAGADTESPWALNPRLAAGDAVDDLTPAGGAVTVVEGVALLEQALAGMLDGQPGVIHATPYAATHLAKLVRREGNLLLTVLDTRVIADAGYPGTGPDGTTPAAGEAWLYATARPTVRRGDITVLTAPADKIAAVNTRTYQATEPAWVAFPCGVAAVRVVTNPTTP